MTVPAIVPLRVYNENGSSLGFATGFPFIAAGDIVVERLGPDGEVETAVLGADYSVSGGAPTSASPPADGAVTLAAARPTGWRLRVRRRTAKTQPADYTPGDTFPAESHERALDRQMLIAQEVDAGLIDLDARALKVPDGEAAATIPPASARSGRFLAFDLEGDPVASSGTGADAGLRADLAAELGGSLVAGSQTGTDTRVFSILELLRKGVVHAWQFDGVDPTGTDDSTAGLANFYDRCIQMAQPGHIGAGRYRVQPGALLFDNGGTRTPWPYITTDGAEAVTFVGIGSDDAPILEWRNGDWDGIASDPYWTGGGHGGLTFELEDGAGTTGRHGISARGLWQLEFGRMRGVGLGGSTIYLPYKVYGIGNNPDPYAVTKCHFNGVEGIGNKVRTFDNRNFVGFNLCRVWDLRANLNEDGLLYGFGAGNDFRKISVATCKGVALDSGPDTGSTATRCLIEDVELDDPEYGLRIARMRMIDVRGLRIVHRFAATALNTSGKYWPLKAIDLAPGSGNITNVNIDVEHRLETGGTKPDLGAFLHLNSAGGNITNTRVNMRIEAGDTGFTFTGSELYAADAFINSTQLRLTRDSQVIFDRIPRGIAIGYANVDGGLVTQATSRTTAVTLDKLTGRITLVSAAGSASWQTFTVNCAPVTSLDTVQVSQRTGIDTMIFATRAKDGAFDISFATTGGTTTEAPTLNFTVLKGQIG